MHTIVCYLVKTQLFTVKKKHNTIIRRDVWLLWVVWIMWVVDGGWCMIVRQSSSHHNKDSRPKMMIMVGKGVGSYLAIFGHHKTHCNHLTWSNVHVSSVNLWQRNNTKDASETDMVIMTTWSLVTSTFPITTLF